ncbi:DUF434 domain-containing protein [Desulfobacterota bacterium AH_259_B03_O07]|nr:DUF434 domain-containing protein [Desulfobacterota bacterium AH_259_B03_O07]
MVNKDKVIAASRDYLYLKRRGYSLRSILEIIGNHFQLNTSERNVLFRGFFTKNEMRDRLTKLVDPRHVNGKNLEIDGYNQLITIESYRKGSFVFISKDGVARDTASVYRSYKISPITEEVLNILFNNLGVIRLAEFIFYFDQPVSHSGKLCEMINGMILKYGLNGKAETVKSPDFILKSGNLVATSDTIIMAGAGSIFDLAGWLIDRVWQPKLVDFREF